MSDSKPAPADRRSFLGKVSGLAMAGGLVAGYGTFLVYAGRYLYPAHPTRTAWFFVTDVKSMRPGDSLDYTTPNGVPLTITHRRPGESGGDFLALSRTCPHLGCQVKWENGKKRYFCPCHGGVFTAEGEGVEGPPKDLDLPRYPLKVEKGLLFIEVPVETVRTSGQEGA